MGNAANQLENLLASGLYKNETPMEFIERLLTIELTTRQDKSREKRMKAAGFPYMKTLEQFDLKFQTSISKTQIRQLKEMSWLEGTYNLLFLGPPGVGKTHLSIALGIEAATMGYSVYFSTMDDLIRLLKTSEITVKSRRKLKSLLASNLVIIDEVGFLPISRQEANIFFQLITNLYQQTSVIITSNKSFEEWGEFLGDIVITAAILDRLAHKSEIFNMTGESYRLKHRETIFKQDWNGKLTH